MTSPDVSNKMFYMERPKGVRGIRVKVPETRHRYLGVRMRGEDAQALEALGRKAGVGISTFARLVLEEYVAAHAPKKGRKG